MNNTAIKKVVTYLCLLLVLSSVFYALILSAGSVNANGGLYTLGLMWMPGLAGMLTQWFYERSLRGMGWKPGRFKYLLLGYAIPLAYCLVIYGSTWLTGLGGVPNSKIVASMAASFPNVPQSYLMARYVIFMATVGLISGLISGAGEEIGWRGLLLPELMRLTSFNKATLITGAIWTIWHMPLILFGDYITPGLPRWYGAIMFAIGVTGINFAFCWLRARSGSFWPAAVLHASHNLFIQAIFTPLTIFTAITPYIIDEFGVGLALTGVALALIFFERRQKAVERQPEAATSL